jgi:DNA-binding MarR family transcriptional regulator
MRISSNNNNAAIGEFIEETEVQTEVLRQSRKRWQGRFLKGPILLREIAQAARLPGQALALFLAVHHQTTLTGKPIITLPAKLLLELGISRDSKARGLKALERAGLVNVLRSKGKAARIQLTKTTGGIECGQF